MIRPPLEVADIVRTYGAAFIEHHRRWLKALHLKVLRALAACRTAALGGHVEQCDSCGHKAIAYNSCLNRHCPKCHGAARQKWLAQRSSELLPVPYYHVVFTIPHVLAPLALQNKTVIYNLLFRTAAETLLQIASDPQHLGAQIGFLAVLHTWGPDPSDPSTSALRGSRRRTRARSSPLDRPRAQVLPPRQSAQPSVSRQVPFRPGTGVPKTQAHSQGPTG